MYFCGSVALKFGSSLVSDHSPLESKQNDVYNSVSGSALSIHILFLSLIDQVAELLQSSILEIVEKCESLKASNVYNIKLFSTNQIKELSEYSKTSLLLVKLSPLFTWSNHSILKALACFSWEAVKLLDDFASDLNLLQPITSHPVPFLSADMIPSDTRTYTILAVRCRIELYDFSLQYIYDVESVMIEKFNITEHCLQLLAVRSDPTIVYWTIPQCVVHLISISVPLHSEYFYSRGILEVSVYPDLLLSTGDDVCVGSLAFVCEDHLFSKEVSLYLPVHFAILLTES